MKRRGFLKALSGGALIAAVGVPETETTVELSAAEIAQQALLPMPAKALPDWYMTWVSQENIEKFLAAGYEICEGDEVSWQSARFQLMQISTEFLDES